MNAETIATIMTVAAPIIALAWKLASSKWKWLNAQLVKTQLDEIAIGAAAETYEEVVRDLKAKAKESADGKLTSEQKKDVMKVAVQKFKDAAKEQGLWKEAGKLAVPVIKGLIEKGVNKLKGDAKEAKA